ncbi:MAG: hypothetical protein KatS3mg072_1320 [Meiothermus sp.]|nr:MAG: hypothetical protein KatS3mg072_1320 [Meiothermus sp.]
MLHNCKATVWLVMGLFVLSGCVAPVPVPQPGRTYQAQLEELRGMSRLEVSPGEAVQAVMQAVRETSPEYWRQTLPPEILSGITAPDGRLDAARVRLETPLRVESLVRPTPDEVMQLAALNRSEALQIAQATPDLARLRAENPQEFEAMVELIALEKARALEVAYSGYYVFPVRVEGVGLVGEVYVSLARLEGRAPSLAAAQYPAPRSSLPYLSLAQAQQLSGSAQGGRLVSLSGLVEGLTREAIWLFGEVAVHAKSGQRYRLTRKLEAAGLTVSARGFRLAVGLEVLP